MKAKPNYIKEVIKEIKNLKKHLTEKQKGRLDVEMFDPSFIDQCIYGQITGNCFSEEARNLIWKCATTKFSFSFINKNGSIQDKSPRVNSDENFTFLEHYINTTRQNNEHIINYIKGIDKTLRLK